MLLPYTLRVFNTKSSLLVRITCLNRHATLRRSGNYPFRLRSRTFSTQKTAPETVNESAPPPSTITFQEGARTATRATFGLSIVGLVIFCATLIGRELMPTSLSPNSIFNAAFDEIRNHPEVVSRVGENPKAYGRDFHTTKEGRRNFVDHDKYTDLDGIKHMRIKFVIAGQQGKLNVYVEKDQTMGSKDFSYIIIEPIVRTSVGAKHEVIAILDNRREIPIEDIQRKVSEKLTKLGAKLYGHTNCQWTQRQLIEFGEFSDKLTVVMCDKKENEADCKKQELPGYPCWILNQEKLPGFQHLEQLKGIVTHM